MKQRQKRPLHFTSLELLSVEMLKRGMQRIAKIKMQKSTKNKKKKPNLNQ